MKNLGASLLSDIQRTVATLATCVEIVRQDFVTIRLTNHDTDLTVDGKTYRHDLPFTLAAVQSGSDLAVDNTDMTLTCDNVTVVLDDFKRGAFDKASVSVFLVDYTAPSHGTIVLRKGWFGQTTPTENNVVTVQIVGLLKTLDFEVGRVYQPSCDADLGDSRCKVSIDTSQAYDITNPYGVGDWFYYLDTTAMTPITLTNPGFEADGARSGSQTITGWTRGPDCKAEVKSFLNGLTPYTGSYALYGGTNGANDIAEQYVYQDIDLVAAGISATDIDDGKICFASNVKMAQDLYVFDTPRFRIEVYDTNGDVLYFKDTGYLELDEIGVWRGRWLTFPLIEGSRTARIYLFFRKTDADIYNSEFDAVTAYWWDHTLGSPHSNVIHNVRRVLDEEPESQAKNFDNPSFDVATSDITNSETTTITGWTRPNGSSDYWSVNGSARAGLDVPDGSRMLRGGDNGSGSAATYQLRQTKHLVNDFKLEAAKILLGGYTCKAVVNVQWYDTTSSAAVHIIFLDDSNNTVLTVPVLASTSQASVQEQTITSRFSIPLTATQVRIRLSATAPGGGQSLADVGFDNVKLFIVDTIRADRNDLLTGYGDDTTAFATTAGGHTWTGNLVLQAHTTHTGYDVVASVTSRKEFTGTSITGAAGVFDTGIIRWLSGANKGQTNLIRVWNSGTKGIKLYFNSVRDIQVGDRFEYVRACHKRFTEDCITQFDNAVNFRGFPHLPGRLT